MGSGGKQNPGVFHCRFPPPAELRCPAPLSFPHGTLEPRFPAYSSGSVLRFTCDDGFVLRGAAELRCRPGGVWSEPPPVCDDGGEREEP